MRKIMIVEDNPEINKMITNLLVEEGYEVTSMPNAIIALENFKSAKVDCVITDLMMPIMSGEEFVQEIRKTSSVHIIVISAKGRALDKVEALGFGADDYLIKPFIEQELIIKLRNYFGKKDTNPSGISIHDGEISFVKGNNSLVINSKQVLFTAVEYLIVELLFERINTIITRDTFMDALYDYDKDITDRVIDVHIRNIRKKISKHSDLKPIKTVYGLGYKLEGDVDA